MGEPMGSPAWVYEMIRARQFMPDRADLLTMYDTMKYKE